MFDYGNLLVNCIVIISYMLKTPLGTGKLCMLKGNKS